MKSLKLLRKEAGFTQGELADRMGVTQSWVSVFEGYEDHRVSSLRRYAEACGARLVVTVDLPPAVKARPLIHGGKNASPSRPDYESHVAGCLKCLKSDSRRGLCSVGKELARSLLPRGTR